MNEAPAQSSPAQSGQTSRPLGYGITCLDAGYVAPGLACFYLMEQHGEYAVLETGTSHSVPVLQQFLRARDIRPGQVRYVIPTHVHLDHAGGAGAMMSLFPDAQLLVHPRGARHMADPERLVAAAIDVYGKSLFDALYGTVLPVDATRIRQMQDGETVMLGDRPLKFLHTRGHAEHHFCVWDETSRGWFSGDMFGVSYPWCRFPGGDFVLPSTTPSQFDPEAFLNSLQLLASYQPQRMYLTHSGALHYTPAVAHLLQRQINEYRAIAADHFAGQSGDSAADINALQLRLSDYAVELCQHFEGSGDADELRKHLAFDMQLNAQGLTMWWQRKSS
jgi:glyoxylase-like metal-dependent hydrolase (beta-lactamase superfamily II)